MPRIYLSLFIAFVALLLGSCGLSERERAVARVNEHIRAVEASSQAVVDAIGALPVGDIATEDFGGVRSALQSYMGEMETLNAAIRALAEYYQELDEHLNSAFRPSAEAAAVSCQHALDTFSAAEATQEDFRGAITRVGQCLERYATAVTNVKAAHDRLSP
ncbi:MAG: hypothetical protein H6698_00865 [Myxococcales bacterium]|nr:hypothetical protein [Myxococcales bacterium]